MKTKCAVGCGKRNYGEDWIHVDGEVLKFDHINHHDVYLKDIPENSLDVIYACHLINYFTREEFKGLLYWWWSRLKEGGVIRIATPDFRMMTHLYQEGQIKLEDIIGPIHGLWTLNMGQISHLTSYDYEELTELLEGEGFGNVKKYDWRETDHANVDDHSQSYLPKMDKEHGVLISLNIECTKVASIS